jgi:hypothetical protein
MKLVSLNMKEETYSALMAYKYKHSGLSISKALEQIIIDHVAQDPELVKQATLRNQNFSNNRNS